MVWLTVGMYGCSITESRQATFTDTPVTVPARCLESGHRDPSKCDLKTAKKKTVKTTLKRPRPNHLSASPPFIFFQGSLT